MVLPDAVGPDDADLVAAHDRRRQVADDGPVAVAEADPFGLDHQGARPLGLLGLHPRGALPLAPLLVGLAHRLEGADPPLVAGAAGLDALADPRLLLGQLLVEEVPLAGLGREQLLAPLQEGGVVARPVGEAAAIELDDPGGQPFQEDPVVGDEDDRAAVAQQERLQPADRLDVEVVGRLVQEQDVGIVDEGPGQQHAALHPRGELREPGVRVEPDPGDDRLHAMVGPAEVMVMVVRVQPVGHLVGDGAAMALGHILGQPRDPQPLLADDRPLVGLDLAADQAEQRALPLAVAPQQAEPLPGSIWRST